jgi:hypothetical protein
LAGFVEDPSKYKGIRLIGELLVLEGHGRVDGGPIVVNVELSGGVAVHGLAHYFVYLELLPTG